MYLYYKYSKYISVVPQHFLMRQFYLTSIMLITIMIPRYFIPYNIPSPFSDLETSVKNCGVNRVSTKEITEVELNLACCIVTN